jgi:flagellar biogenesis protein FliO
MLQQSRIVTRLNVWAAASGSMGCALCMVIGAILVVKQFIWKQQEK